MRRRSLSRNEAKMAVRIKDVGFSKLEQTVEHLLDLTCNHRPCRCSVFSASDRPPPLRVLHINKRVALFHSHTPSSKSSHPLCSPSPTLFCTLFAIHPARLSLDACHPNRPTVSVPPCLIRLLDPSTHRCLSQRRPSLSSRLFVVLQARPPTSA